MDFLECELFFFLYFQALRFGGIQKGLINKKLTVDDVREIDLDRKYELRENLFTNDAYLLKQYIRQNPDELIPKDWEIVKGFTHFIKEDFYVVKYLKKHTIFLGKKYAFGVHALYKSFELTLGNQLPTPVSAVLLPFKGRIVYDGMLSYRNIYFGGSLKKHFLQEYNEAKAKYGIITSLPIKVEKEEFSDKDMLEIYMKSYSSIDVNWNKIKSILDKKEKGIIDYYNQLFGKLKAKEAKNKFKEINVKGYYFAIYKDTIIASAKKRNDLESQLSAMLETKDLASIYIFKY